MADQEVELKLSVRSEDLPRIRNSPLLSGAGQRAATHRLENVYYDTADFRLRERHAMLRIRKQGRRYVQTLKLASDQVGGAFQRGEWEAAVASPVPDLAAHAAEAAQASLDCVAADELRPIFVSDIMRTTRHLDGAAGAGHPGGIEVSIDEGEIRAPDGTTIAISEVELELKGGSARSLFELALALSETAPLRVETRSKAERGYALIHESGKAPAVRAAPVRLRRAMTVEMAIDAIMRHCIDHLARNEALLVESARPEALHQMRVALRRMRSAFLIFKPLLPPGQYAFFVGEIKWLARALGAARDWDVFLGEMFQPVRKALAQDADLTAFALASEERRARRYDEAKEAVLSRRYTSLLLKLGAWIEGRLWREQSVSERSAMLFQPISTLADHILRKRLKTIRRHGADLAGSSSADRHRLRIEVKRLRYAVEFVAALYRRKPVLRYLKRLTALQDQLGHFNDVATARLLVSQLRPEPPGEEAAFGNAAGKVIGWHARGVHDGTPALAGEWRRFARLKPFWTR